MWLSHFTAASRYPCARFLFANNLVDQRARPIEALRERVARRAGIGDNAWLTVGEDDRHVLHAAPPSAGGGRGRKPPEPQDPTRHRAAYPSQASPGAFHATAPHVPDSAQPIRAPLEEQGPGRQPSPVAQSKSVRQNAPVDPLLQAPPPGEPTHASGAAHPPGQSPVPSPQDAPAWPSVLQVLVADAQYEPAWHSAVRPSHAAPTPPCVSAVHV